MSFILVGNNNNTLPYRYGLDNFANLPDQLQQPTSFFRPPTNFTFSTSSWRSWTHVGLVDKDSAAFKASQFTPNYIKSSVMSLDGLLSPVSFYPVPYHGTFPIVPYTRSKCPWCKGTGSWSGNVKKVSRLNSTYDDIDAGDPGTKDPLPAAGSWPNRQQSNISSHSPRDKIKTTDSQPCNFCIPDADKAKLKTSRVSSSNIMPPTLIGKGTDLEIIDDRDEYLKLETNIINKFSLNPIVTTNGDFDINQAKQTTDSCAHSIFLSANQYALDGLTTTSDASYKGEVSDGTKEYENNQRFFALRGPLMVHGWGYDTEGYPVPNSSGEYKYAADGTPVLYNGKPMYKNQEIQPDGTLSKPYKEKTFYKGWASTPTTWPVGPIDLRFDEKSGMWTMAGQYKNVWITIETDLTNQNPVRGVIEEDTDSSIELLPDGYRRVVYVKDPVGLLKAPRGAPIYCKYNEQNGFYEPIYNQPFTAVGTIRSSSIADIENTFTIAYAKNGVISTYDGTTFVNPLSLNTIAGNKGIFNYIAGKWTLVNSQ